MGSIIIIELHCCHWGIYTVVGACEVGHIGVMPMSWVGVGVSGRGIVKLFGMLLLGTRAVSGGK